MAEDKKLPAEEAEEEVEYYTLTDEDGNESQFELLSTAELDGKTYYALTELDDKGQEVGDEYVILRLVIENGEEMLESIDDDEEFDRVADYFDDEFADIDYDK